MSDYHPLDKELPSTDVTNDELMQILAGDMLPRDVHWKRRDAERKKIKDAAWADLPNYVKTIDTRSLLKVHRDGAIQTYAHIGILYEVSYTERVEKIVRAELATREHIPNKPEAKALRRAAASKHHGPKRRA